MLEKIREGSQGIIAKTILGLVILTFALAGVGNYLNRPAETSVAVVNGEKIDKTTFDQAFQNQRARMQQQFGEMYATLAADSAYMSNFRKDVLERLIEETLQKQYAQQLGLRVGDDQVRDAIRQMAEFQVDGQFNNERYLALLRQAGYQPEEFRELMRQQLAGNQLIVGLLSTEFATASEMQQLMKLQQQTRDVEYVRLNAADFANDVEITDQMLQDYYATNMQQFETEQKVAVDYIELSAADLAEKITVSEQQIEEYYAANVSRYTRDERRQVAHIMLEAEEDNAAVKAEAEALLQQLKEGADFAELAQKHSADTFSAENGGVLDWLSPGDMDADFEEAAFALNEEGELSQVIKSAYGYHIIKLKQLEPAQVKPLSEVSADIAERIKQDEAMSEFYQLQQRLAEVSFEVPDTLEDAAQAIDAKVKSTPLFSRTEATLPLTEPQVLTKLFDSEFITEGVNSDVIELDNDRVLVVRIKQHQPARTKTFDEVKAQVEAAVKNEQSALLAQQRAQQLLDNADGSLAKLAAEKGLTLQQEAATPRFGGTLNAEIRAKAFTLPRPEDNPAIELVTLKEGDVALVSVTAVNDAEVTAIPEASQLDRLSEQQAERTYRALIAKLKADAEITRNLKAASTESL